MVDCSTRSYQRRRGLRSLSVFCGRFWLRLTQWLHPVRSPRRQMQDEVRCRGGRLIPGNGVAQSRDHANKACPIQGAAMQSLLRPCAQNIPTGQFHARSAWTSAYRVFLALASAPPLQVVLDGDTSFQLVVARTAFNSSMPFSIFPTGVAPWWSAQHHDARSTESGRWPIRKRS